MQSEIETVENAIAIVKEAFRELGRQLAREFDAFGKVLYVSRVANRNMKAARRERRHYNQTHGKHGLKRPK